MYFLNYIYMALYIGIFLFYQGASSPFPPALKTLNVWVSWAFLAWGAFMAGRVIVDCLMLSAKGQMTSANMTSGIMLAVLHFLPVLGMSVFMLKEGFK